MLKFVRFTGALLIAFSVGFFGTKQLTADTLPSAEIQSVITQQIAAFGRDDAPAAFSYAAPSIKAMFRDPDTFMQMVKEGYRPVYRPTEYSFERLEQQGARYVQYVDIIGPEGGLWTARYQLQRDTDGTLKISACHLVKKPGEAV